MILSLHTVCVSGVQEDAKTGRGEDREKGCGFEAAPRMPVAVSVAAFDVFCVGMVCNRAGDQSSSFMRAVPFL
ncbi:hypothetical protein DSM19430T_01910 [Desulfovibrio psychrotolerans]|uniref:Uncharacterized protein n=1 Tax=Desulfovibrio psychrotolerans TaxID=415242 RepID=A0A7J0BP89_9BACT|nr:hypothetical protein DSM19430T_01910 [Desulfovibrio psychrotolerans]